MRSHLSDVWFRTTDLEVVSEVASGDLVVMAATRRFGMGSSERHTLRSSARLKPSTNGSTLSAGPST